MTSPDNTPSPDGNLQSAPQSEADGVLAKRHTLTDHQYGAEYDTFTTTTRTTITITTIFLEMTPPKSRFGAKTM